MRKISTQVLIAGCGPVGLTLANCLVKSPFIQSVALLDRKIPSQSRQLPSLANQRVFSINGPSLRVLNNLKVLPIIRQRGIMSRVQVVSKESQSFVNWSDNEANVIQNDELVYGLMSGLKNSSHFNKITFLEDQVHQIQNNPDSISVKLKNNEKNIQVQTKLLVGSDGINSNIKRLAGISHYGWQYRQKGIVCTMKVDQLADNTSAYQIYHDGNVLALLPLWDNYLSLVWSVGLPDFQHLMQLSDNQFKQNLNNVIINSNNHMKRKANYVEIPQISEIVNKRLSFPLSTMQSSSYTKQRIALVGDAAHTIHPMAGLGVNSGIMDSILLANNIIRNIKSGNDIGDLIALSQYEAKAKSFNYANSLAMETIKKTFETDGWIFNKLRSLGMGVAQSSSIIKQAMKDAVDDQSLKYEWQYA